MFKKNKKYYESIISLGRNCEYAYKYKNLYGFVDSTLLTYVGSYNKDFLLASIDNPDIFFSQGYYYDQNMNTFTCKYTNYFFHGRKDPSLLKEINFSDFEEIEKDEYEELTSRIKYLKEKTKK